jgi:hypothetical protein
MVPLRNDEFTDGTANRKGAAIPRSDCGGAVQLPTKAALDLRCLVA